MSVKVKYIGVKDFIARVQVMLDQRLANENFMRQLGALMVDRIKRRTWSGKDFENKPFEPLTKYTKKRRAQLASYNNTTHQFYRLAKSSLTFTGQMVDSIKAFVKRSFLGKRLFEIRADGRRTLLVGKKGQFLKDQELYNNNLAITHAKGGAYLPVRKFIGIDAIGVKLIRREVVRDLRNQIKRLK